MDKEKDEGHAIELVWIRVAVLIFLGFASLEKKTEGYCFGIAVRIVCLLGIVGIEFGLGNGWAVVINE